LGVSWAEKEDWATKAGSSSPTLKLFFLLLIFRIYNLKEGTSTDYQNRFQNSFQILANSRVSVLTQN
jgi:hypothetical protein